MVDLSIIILSYKSKKHLEVLLPSIFDSAEISFDHTARKYFAEVIVVDNDSQDGTLEDLKSANLPVTLIHNINNGFSKGNNLGIKKSSGRYILLLNPDTKVLPDTLVTMLDFMETHPEVGISGCKLIKGNGKLDLACRRRFPNPATSFKRLFLKDNSDYNYTNIDENTEMEVDSVVGAFLLIRKTVINKIGLLDEDFFMYGEDLDWCWRCKEGGFKVWYYPKTFIYHYKGESSKRAPFRSLKAFHDAMWIFYKKHYQPEYHFIFNVLVWSGIYLRLVVLGFVNLFKINPRVSK